MKGNLLIAVGRRKTARAIVKMSEGEGKIIVNGKSVEQYFPLITQQAEVLKPLKITGLDGKFNIEVKSLGGGTSGQIDAIKLGIARAIVKYDPDLTSKLREFTLLTRDPRMKERKKYGQKGARKRFQWTKR
ncbi:MAG: 30S ribosomal protein S9 [Candidatus Omnitrophica bacterium]|nr:30S ribosomal protein S9 [Candidatus Omnitrophota bacterium]MCM8788511.1 30S ribosomal protein S9 [Candidatus Omnitrophota bacterium]